jgi:hypothetical protein
MFFVVNTQIPRAESLNLSHIFFEKAERLKISGFTLFMRRF